MTKSSFGRFAAVALAAVLLTATAAWACLALVPPYAAIEYSPAEALALHGSAEAFDKAAPTHLRDVTAGDAAHWFNRDAGEITTLRGYAHIGVQGATQQQANANVQLIQIWGWLDTNGNGAADAGDTTTAWTKLVEHTPSANGGDGSGGNVVGWDIPYPPAPAIETSTWQGDLLQGQTIQINPGTSWLLLIRVVDISGNTNLMAAVGGLERWDNGAEDGIGSDVTDERYVDAKGNTPGTTDGRIQDKHVAWVYRPRLR